jgi:hypothetical protein
LLATALFALLSRFDRLGSDLRAEMRDLRTDLRAEIREVTEAVHRLDVRLTSAGG